MTVKELKKKLEKLDDNMEVFYSNYYYGDELPGLVDLDIDSVFLSDRKDKNIVVLSG